MFSRFSRFLTILCVFNTFFLLINLYSQNVTAHEYSADQEKERLDLNKINSSVDAGSFYSVEVSIKQLEENMLKMAQELKRLKQHVEFAKLAEQKRILHVQKLEKENIKSCQSWLDNSLDNSWTGSSSKITYPDDKSYDNNTNKHQTFDSNITESFVMQSDKSSDKTILDQPKSTSVIKTGALQSVSQVVGQNGVHQDVVVQVVEYKVN
jgi:hypothetical protein